MSKTTRHKGIQSTRFSCPAADAKAVFLAGTFNKWNAVDLKPGRYEYKFVVDGAWCCGPGHDGDDHECPECVPNSFGTKNRVLEVT